MAVIKFICTTVFAFVVAFNLSAASASLHPLLGVMTLVVTVLVTVALLDRLGERWAPSAMRGFGSWCRATVRHLQAR